MFFLEILRNQKGIISPLEQKSSQLFLRTDTTLHMKNAFSYEQDVLLVSHKINFVPSLMLLVALGVV